MVDFSGFFCGQAFSKEADDPLDLISKLLPSKNFDDLCKDYRMWLKCIDVAGEYFWADIAISTRSTSPYQTFLKFCENKNHLKVIIRSKGESSPATSPRGETSSEMTTPLKSLPPTPTGSDLLDVHNFSLLTDSSERI